MENKIKKSKKQPLLSKYLLIVAPSVTIWLAVIMLLPNNFSSIIFYGILVGTLAYIILNRAELFKNTKSPTSINKIFILLLSWDVLVVLLPYFIYRKVKHILR